MAHMGEQQDILFEALRNREEEEGTQTRKTRKPTAPHPETYRQPGPPSYAAAGRGRLGYAATPQSPGYSLGATQSLIAGLQEHEASTAGHSLGMNVAGLQGEAAEMLGGFRIGRDQGATRGAPVAINIADMMERR
jgi:hypothetical protein